jgi:hypothetical protein
MNRNLPAIPTIRNLRTGATTELEGSKLKHGVKYDDAEFTADGPNRIAPPKS